MSKQKTVLVYIVSREVNLRQKALPKYLLHPKTFGHKLRKWRIENNLSAKALSRLIRVDETTITNWEIRNRTPLIKHVRKIREITGIELKGESMRKAGRLPGNPETK